MALSFDGQLIIRFAKHELHSINFPSINNNTINAAPHPQPPLFRFQLQDIDYDSFRRFLDAFLDCETPEELVKHLFVSFLKPAFTVLQGPGSKALSQMAAISSTAACAPVTSHTKGSIPNLNTLVEIAPTPPEPKQSFVDKIHGLTDKLQSTLGKGGGSSNSSQSYMNSGSGASTLEDRNKTGRHLMLLPVINDAGNAVRK